ETRDFTYVDDIGDGIMRADHSAGAIGKEINLASGKETRIIDLATMVNDLTGNKSGIAYSSQRKWDTKRRLLASIDRARELLGYSPQTTFADGISATIQWFRENWDQIKSSASFEPGMSSAVRDVASIPENQRVFSATK